MTLAEVRQWLGMVAADGSFVGTLTRIAQQKAEASIRGEIRNVKG